MRSVGTAVRAAVATVLLLGSGYFVLYGVEMLRDPPELGLGLGLALLAIASALAAGAVAAMFVGRR